MQAIRLSRGRFAVVDDEDFPRIAGSRWSFKPERNGIEGYAVRNGIIDGNRR